MASGTAAVVLALVSTTAFAQPSSPGTNFLKDYEAIPGYEVDGIKPYAVIPSVDAETCARNCSSEKRFTCEHFQYHPDKAQPPGICYFFVIETRAYIEASEATTIYTKNRKKFAGIPESSASSAIFGSAFLSRLLTLFAGAAFVFITT